MPHFRGWPAAEQLSRWGSCLIPTYAPDDPSLLTATASEVFTHWQWPLHSDQAFGMTKSGIHLLNPRIIATDII